MKCPKCNSECAIGSGGITSTEIRDGLHCPDCGYSYEHVEKINNFNKPNPPKAGTTPSPNSQTPPYTPPPMPEVKAPKQRTVLSVRDFAILYMIINNKIEGMENPTIFNYRQTEKERAKEIEKHRERLRQDSYYQDLLRIRDKLGELNIEVETPRVEVEE